ncbi:MAG TPA: response regulator transcription factor [Thermotogota bacterium]|nr:response regulator transcription factor [Thermotogota bacterium]HPJ89837.1 response regulator transcription factor [Thermotogota bacterium]HPR96906.1 response regulator transcription factor [Thermotogota bacterium]
MKLIIVDDDKLVCSALKRIVEASGITVEAVGYSGEDAVALYEVHHPDILLMDIRMGGMTGLEAGKKILVRHPSARILFLTTFNDDEYIVKVLGMGAKGYLLKQDFETIVPALKAVEQGQSIFGDEIVSRIPEMLLKERGKKDNESFDLSEREGEIVALVAEGLSNREIALKLFLSEGTVRNYISVILEKLSLRDRTQLAIFYYKNLH